MVLAVLAATAVEASADDLAPPPPPAIGELSTALSALPTEDPSSPDATTAADELRLRDVLDIIWRDSPEVRQAELALEATHFDISGAQTGYFPYASIDTGQGRQYDYTVIHIVQPLWNGGLTTAQVHLAKAQQEEALARLNQARLDIALQAVDAYFNIAVAQDRADQYADYVAALERLRKVIERRAAEGVGTQADVETAVTRLNQAAANVESNRSTLLSNQARLSQLIDKPVGRVRWPTDADLLTDAEIELTVSKAVDAHPARQLALAQIHLQQATADRSKASLWPEIYAQYSRQVTGQVIDPANQDATIIGLRYQTNNGLSAYRSYQAEKQRTAATQESLQAAIRKIRSDIGVARAQRQSAQAQIAAQQLAVDSSNRLVDSFLRQFEVGRKSWLEVLNAQREASDTLLSSINARQGLWTANSQLILQTLNWRRLSVHAPVVDVIAEKEHQ